MQQQTDDDDNGDYNSGEKKKKEKRTMNDNDGNKNYNSNNDNDGEDKLLENDDDGNSTNNKMSSSCDEVESSAVNIATSATSDDDDDDGSLLDSSQAQQQQHDSSSSSAPGIATSKPVTSQGERDISSDQSSSSSIPPSSSSPTTAKFQEEEEDVSADATSNNNGKDAITTPAGVIGNATVSGATTKATNDDSNNNISSPSKSALKATTVKIIGKERIIASRQNNDHDDGIVFEEKKHQQEVELDAADEIAEEEKQQEVDDDANNKYKNHRLDLSTTTTAASISDNNNSKLCTNVDNATTMMNQSSSSSTTTASTSHSRPGAISVVPGKPTRHVEGRINNKEAKLNATTTTNIEDSSNNTNMTSGNDTSNTDHTSITDIPIIYADCYNNKESNNPSSTPTATIVSDNDNSGGVNHDNSNWKDYDNGVATTSAAAAAVSSNGDDRKGEDEDEEGERIQETPKKPLPTIASLEEPTPAATAATTTTDGNVDENKIPPFPTTPGGIDIEVVEAETVDEENLQNLQRLMDQLRNAPRAEIVRVEIDESHEFTISSPVSPSRGGGVGSSQQQREQQQRQQTQFSQLHQAQQPDQERRRHHVGSNNNNNNNEEEEEEDTASDNNSHRDEAKSSPHPSKQVLVLTLLSIIIIVIVVVVVLVKQNDDDEEQLEQQKTTAAASPTMSPTTITNNNVLAPTLQNIHNRGYIKCRGVPSEDKQGFGFSYDMCSAFAAAILGDSNKYEMVPMPFVEKFSGIANGTIDISTGMTTPTMQRDIREPTSQDGMTFTTPYFYGGITFYGIPEYVDCANRGDTLLGICRDLVVCAMEGTVQVYHTRRHLGGSVIHTVSIERDLFDRLDDSTCNVATVMPQTVYEHITNLEKEGIDATKYIEDGTYVLSSKTLDRDPLAFTSRNDDPEFGDIINWLLRALIVAEVMNITQTTAHLFPTTDLFGDDYRYMFQNAITAVGNYGELYAKWWEARSPRTSITSGRGINTPHLYPADGGLLYPNPLGNIALEGGAVFSSSSQQQQAPPILKEGGTLEIIEERQILYCGIIKGRPGLAEWDDVSNSWVGLDVDYCSGLAAALFAGNTASSLFLVTFESLDGGFVALAKEDIDVLAGATYNMENDVKEPTTGQGFAFGNIYYYYDYQIHNVTTDGRDDEGSRNNVVLAMSMATRQEDVQWTDFVRSIVVSTIHAEANGISKSTAFEMPLLELLGPTYRQALRDVILHIGNYAELYERNMEHIVPRVNNTRNSLNDGTPMFYINWLF